MKRTLALAVIATAGSLLISVAPSQASSGLTRPGVALVPISGASDQTPGEASAVPPAARDRVLPSGWRLSDDRVLVTAGDATGLHILVAELRTGYTWRTVTTLAEPGFDTDQWIGNACVTGSGRRAVVVYAPRSFTNDMDLFDRGGFTAVVDLDTGAVHKTPALSTLAYFSPGCGAGETAVLTRFNDVGSGRPRSRLTIVDAAGRSNAREWTVDGEVSSAVPVRGGVVAADGARLIRLDDTGRRMGLVRTTNVPFHLRADGDGAVVYADRAGERVQINRAASVHAAEASVLAEGPVGKVGTVSSLGGRVYLVGSPDVVRKLPASIQRVNVDRDAIVSSHGQLAVNRVAWFGTAGTATAVVSAGQRRLQIDATLLATGQMLRFGVAPSSSSLGGTVHPSLQSAGTSQSLTGSPTDPVDEDRSCSVPRNDARTQVYQPTPRQVEWASDQAVTGNLTMTRPANWRQSGLPAWSPQGMFPRIPLLGGGRVPVQVLLGILTQESNLWQASNHALPGVTGNPLIGNFYGRQIYNGDPNDDWVIDWNEADCGYGVAQVTDGMRLAGQERPGEVTLPANQQRAIALDYATNIAAGLRILASKWNETRQAGLIVNDGDPANIENWYFAVWAYNSGFHPNQGNGEPWGVGWFNNPANPRYPADRDPFLEWTYTDAAHPQDWPYPEKVLGWAGHPIESVVTPDTMIAGYRAAWWTSVANRITVMPPIYQFCDSTNSCVPGGVFVPNAPDVSGEPAGPCAHRNGANQYDLRCWYHQPTLWKDCNSQCGFELLRFDSTYPEQPDGTSYPPNCSLTGLPAGALIIDDVPDSVPAVRTSCGHPWTNQGSFGLTFASTSSGLYSSKVDFHQIGGGFGGHFWFAHTRNAQHDGAMMTVTGTWTLGQNLNGWARVLVHMPDHGAHTQQAAYDVLLGNGTKKTRLLLQRTMAHRWVSLGSFLFNGTPQVRLSTQTNDGDGSEDIAFDAVAFQPLPGKPSHQVVALGDSYASGEGASASGGVDYYRETDNNGGNPDIRNGCHRSRNAWSRKAVLPDKASQSIGQRADVWDPSLDYQLLACSGAKTENLLPNLTVPAGQPKPTNDIGLTGTGQFGEVSQLDRGFLDENTTLVTLSIGGNDIRFGDIIAECVWAAGPMLCQDAHLDGDTDTVAVATRRRLDEMENSIVTVLRQVHLLAPNAKIALMGYPKLLENDGQCVPGIGTSEAPWLEATGVDLDNHLLTATVRADALGVPVWFSDPTNEFAGRGVCGNPESINGIILDKTPGDLPGLIPPQSQQSFHPKNDGTTLYAASLNETIGTMEL